MNEIEFVELQAQILVTREGIKEIGIETDLDNILADKIGDYIKGLSGEAEEELRDYLTDYLTPFLKENQTLQSLADEVNGESLDQLSSLEDMENLMDNKKQELTGRTTAILDGAKAEAARLQAESEQRAREEADRIREEAEKALEDAAKNLKLPGF